MLGQIAELGLCRTGHGPGSMSYYFEQQKIVCPGDTLFQDSVGRTNWAGIPSLQAGMVSWGTPDALVPKEPKGCVKTAVCTVKFRRKSPVRNQTVRKQGPPQNIRQQKQHIRKQEHRQNNNRTTNAKAGSGHLRRQPDHREHQIQAADLGWGRAGHLGPRA